MAVNKNTIQELILQMDQADSAIREAQTKKRRAEFEMIGELVKGNVFEGLRVNPRFLDRIRRET